MIWNSNSAMRPAREWCFAVVVVTFLAFAGSGQGAGMSPKAAFDKGADAYQSGRVPEATRMFRESAAVRPAAGTLQNLGLAEWLRGRAGHAVLAWEQALWLDNFNSAARGNLRFARKHAQLESPELRWYEVVSTWLPVNWWAWIAGISLWSAVILAVVPGILRIPKASSHQALAAFGLMVFLLSMPPQLGIHTRSRIGFVLRKDTPLRLTPTVQSQVITSLAPGEPARVRKARGNYLLVRTSRGQGWIDKDFFGLIVPK